MNTFTLTMALLMGLTGSLHCVGMCGPIIWMLPFQAQQGFRKAAAITLYHFGRTTTYVALGWLFYSFRSIFHPEWQQILSLVLGGLFLLMGILAFVPNSFFKFSTPWAGQVKTQLGKLIGNPAVGTFLFTGVLNGLLPCGLVYMALAASMAAHSFGEVAALLYSFGLGTIPMLLMISFFKSSVSALHLQQLKRSVPAIMFLFGSLFLLRGMNLGIPYLSPRITVEQSQIKTTCCHK